MSANLIDPKAIEQYLDGFLPGQPEAARLLKLALAKPLAQRERNLQTLVELAPDAPDWLRRKWPEGGPYHRFKPDADLHQQVRHIADWIAAAVTDQEPWLDRVDKGDKDKKPYRFSNIHTLEDAYAQADKAMRERNKRLAKTLTPDGEGEQTVMPLEGGFRIVQLLTPTALDREGVKMGHCIGQGAYDKGLEKDSRRFFSLRDAKGEPHATLEVAAETNALVQCQGKENKPPIARYLPQIAAFVEREKFRLEVPSSRTGLVETDGRYYSIYNLPENLTVKGDLDLSETPITALPKGVTVGGDLDLSYTPITALPEGLTVGGSLYLSNTPTTALPKGLTVGGDLYLSNASITALPAGLKVVRSLDLSNTPITALPAGLMVGGNLDLHNTPITALPAGLKVGGDLNLRETKITQLPEGLTVGGLYLSNTPITALPEGLTVGGTLDLSNTPITALPERLTVAHSLDLSNTPITALPEGLTVGGNLYLYNTPITALPAGLKVGGDLKAAGSRVIKIPPDAQIGGGVFGLSKHRDEEYARRQANPARSR